MKKEMQNENMITQQDMISWFTEPKYFTEMQDLG